MALVTKQAHIQAMAKTAQIQKSMVLLSSGKVVEVRGYGALKGQLALMPGIDLTKPIYEQVIRKKTPKAAAREG